MNENEKLKQFIKLWSISQHFQATFEKIYWNEYTQLGTIAICIRRIIFGVLIAYESWT